MLIYKVRSLADLTLTKYSAFADTGVKGMLDAQTQFIRQLKRIAEIGNVHIHFLYDYDPGRQHGKKLEIFLLFGTENTSAFYNRLRKIIQASVIYKYFHLEEVQKDRFRITRNYTNLTTLRKKEIFVNSVIDEKNQAFYVVPNWKLSDEARLYQFFKLLESFDEKCSYRVDLFAIESYEDQLRRNFEKPLMYLHNASYKQIGISELSRMRQTKTDPSVNEIVHQYEDWLKNVASSSVFQCRVLLMSNNPQTGPILLNSIIPENIKEGNATISNSTGKYQTLSYVNCLPQDEYIEGTPKTMQKWSTTYTAEEIATFTRLPVLYDGEVIELPKETAAVTEEQGIVLGTDQNGHNVNISLNLFPKHMFVCGVPGAGKTNTMLLLANSLWNYRVRDSHGAMKKAHIPFLVLEPAKKEYRELALLDIPELIIFSPSARTNFPLTINPFEFTQGLTLSEHIANLCSVFEGAFPIPTPAPFILDRSIQAIYEKEGWKTSDINDGSKPYPCLSDLYMQFKKEMENTSYDAEFKGNVSSVLEMRIGSLLRREKKDIFDVKKSVFTPEEWLHRPVIIELEALGKDCANFLTLLLCTLIRETLKVNPTEDRERPVRHVIFIEEAHNLISPESDMDDPNNSNPKIAATAFIVKMLAEVRALREGIIIADQLPTAMAPEVIKNTNIKLVHRLTSNDDRELIGSTMSASGLQMEEVATFISGQALIIFEKMLRPFCIQVNQVEEHGTKTPTDDELYELMMKRDAFRKTQSTMLRNSQEEKFDSLKRQFADYCSTYTKIQVALKTNNSDSVSAKEFEGYAEKISRDINLLKIIYESLNKEVKQLSEQFVGRGRIQKLMESLSNVNPHALEVNLALWIYQF